MVCTRHNSWFHQLPEYPYNSYIWLDAATVQTIISAWCLLIFKSKDVRWEGDNRVPKGVNFGWFVSNQTQFTQCMANLRELAIKQTILYQEDMKNNKSESEKYDFWDGSWNIFWLNAKICNSRLNKSPSPKKSKCTNGDLVEPTKFLGMTQKDPRWAGGKLWGEKWKNKNRTRDTQWDLLQTGQCSELSWKLYVQVCV